ncbi:MAG: hypothetical protein AAF393_18740 [Pseudomonadota bacterium]
MGLVLLPIYPASLSQSVLIAALALATYGTMLGTLALRQNTLAVVGLAGVQWLALAGLFVTSSITGKAWLLMGAVMGLYAVICLHQLRPVLPQDLLRFRLSVWHCVAGICVALVLAVVDTSRDDTRRALFFHDHPLEQAGQWLRANTAPNTMVLPVDVNVLAAVSRRPVWVDWKIGAVVMWDPSIYSLWKDRYLAWKAISSPEDALAIARAHGIGFILFRKSQYPAQDAPGLQMRYEDKRFWIAEVS